MAEDQDYGRGDNGKRAAEDQRQSHNKRPREGDYDQVVFRLLIRSYTAGGVIGKGGENIKRLRSDYDAKVSIPDCNGPERIIKIVTKNLDNGLDCIRDVIPCIGEKKHSQEEGNSFIRIIIHQSHAGAIIGRAGFKIKELREKTGAVFKVFTEICPKSTDRVVQLSGNSDVIIKAAAEVYNICTDTPVKGPVQDYDPFCYDLDYCDKYGGYMFDSEEGGERGGRGYGGGGQWNRGGPPMRPSPGGRGSFNHMGGNDNFGFGRSPFGGGGSRGYGGMGMRGGRGGGRGRGGFGGHGGQQYNEPNFDFRQNRSSSDYDSSSGGATSIQTQQVTIPNDLAGAIIGKGGQRIRNIRTRSGAQIKIDDSQEGSKERIITISGTAESITFAKCLLQSSVREYQSQGNRF